MDQQVRPTVLLTGGTGFLGSNILKVLISEGYRVVLLKRSFSNTSRLEKNISNVKTYDIDLIDLKQVFSENKIVTILHCATDYGRKTSDPLQILDANLTFPLRLLELAKQNKVNCFINTDTVLEKHFNNYTLSKKQFLEWFFKYQHSMCCVNISLEHFYGPGDDETKFVTKVIQAMVKKLPNLDLTLGEQERDFIYIDDVVSAFLLLLKKYSHLNQGYFNFELGTGQLISIKNLVLKIQQLSSNFDIKLNFGAIPYRENEMSGHKSDLEPIYKLGWRCNNSLEQGLTKTINP